MQTHPTRYPTDLTDEEWDQIKSLVPSPKSGKGKRGRPIQIGRRDLVNAIFYVVRSGGAWRLLPKDFGPWQTVYGYFRVWCQDWTWRFIHDALRDCLRKTEGRKVAPTAAIVDSQSVKTPDQAGERGYDAAKKLSGRKRHFGSGQLGIDSGHENHFRSRAGPRRGQRPHHPSALDVSTSADHLGRRRLLGRVGHVGQAIASVRQIEIGDRATV